MSYYSGGGGMRGGIGGHDPRAGGPAGGGYSSAGYKGSSKFSTPRAELHRPQDGGGQGGSDDEIYRSPFHLSKSYDDSMRWFSDKKRAMARKGKLYEDPFFPAIDKSIFFSHRPPKPFQWKRPREIDPDPEFLVSGLSRFDVRQGELGDCWLLAAVASLSMDQELVKHVVPPQNFKEDYCGMFLFRFWQFGDWVDVVVDDRLPTYQGRLVFMHSTDKNEFWSALLEKAYSKLCGSYEALKGGSTSEAMEDFTGGITETFELTEPPKDLWDVIFKGNKRRSLMGCSIEADPSEIEAKAAFGLIKGHAYSITDVKLAQRSRGGPVRLIRIRNPWGTSEWSGAWSDDSTHWRDISDSERRQMGLVNEDDGEFWMCFEDFIKYFTKLEICHLSPSSDCASTSSAKKRRWEMTRQEGEWKRNITAGGCRNFIDTFHLNPQFHVTVVDPDEDDSENMGTLIVGLMQKEMRKKRAEGQDMWTIGYAVYKKPANLSGSNLLDMRFFKFNTSTAKAPSFINLREVCGRHKLPPGEYVIVPSTFEPKQEAKFILRIFSEQPSRSKEMDEETSMVITTPEHRDDEPKTPQEEEQDRKLLNVFNTIAGEDMEIDTFELRDILNAAFKKEFAFDGFSIETCRSMIAMMDVDQSGMLGYDEFRLLWNDLRLWKTIFKKMDADNSGNFNAFELRGALNYVGFKVSNKIFNSVVTRYASKQGIITFDDYILLLVRLKTVFETFKAQQKTSDGRAVFKQDEFIQSVIYI